MKYNVLGAYSDYLRERYSKETARTYRTRLDFLLSGQFLIQEINDVDFSKVMSQLEKVKYKNYFSQCKNSLYRFMEFGDKKLNNEYVKKIAELECKAHKKYRKLKVIDYQEISKTITALKNDKLNLSFKTMMRTGLRVSELAQIKHQNCQIAGDNIIFKFTGKGGENENVTLFMKDEKVFFQKLVYHIQSTEYDKKVFYSAIYLQEKAKKLGFKCHDLRRIYAQSEYKKTHDKNEVRKKLRHTSVKTTNIYLSYKIRGLK